MQDIIGIRQAIWVQARFSPRYLVALEQRNESWWYVLWYRNNHHWRYRVFEAVDGPDIVEIPPRFGVVLSFGCMRDRNCYLVLEEIDYDHLPDRLLYWAVQHWNSNGNPPCFDVVLSFHTAEEASWEAYVCRLVLSSIFRVL